MTAVATAVCLLMSSAAVEAGGLFTVTDIVASLQADGSTEVRISADTSFRDGEYFRFRNQQAAPREVLRIQGVKSPYRVKEIPVHDGNVLRIRVGHSTNRDPPGLTLVFDLVSRDVQITEIENQGKQLVVRLAGGVPAPTVSASLPVPTDTPLQPAQATPTVATATATRRPTPAPTPTPPSQATAQQTLPAVLYAAAPGTITEDSPSSTRRAFPDDQLPLITEIIASQRPSGATLLRITVDRTVGKLRIGHRRNLLDPRRHVVVIQGLGLSAVPPAIAAEIPNLSGIELNQPDIEYGPPELWIFLLLSSEQVNVSDVVFKGRHLVVVLDPPA